MVKRASMPPLDKQGCSRLPSAAFLWSRCLFGPNIRHESVFDTQELSMAALAFRQSSRADKAKARIIEFCRDCRLSSDPGVDPENGV